MIRKEIIVGRDGSARAVYSPQTDKILKSLGKTETRRASHVEPTPELSTDALQWLEASTDMTTRSSSFNKEIRVVSAYQDSWWADMTPLQQGPVLGPYVTREEALAEEVRWLADNNVPAHHEWTTQIEPITQPVLTREDLNGT